MAERQKVIMDRDFRPRIEYDRKVDAGYIQLVSDVAKISRTIELTDYIRVDYAGDIPVGIEILSVKRIMPGLLPHLATLTRTGSISLC